MDCLDSCLRRNDISKKLQQQIEQEVSEQEIRKSWQKDLMHQ